MLSPPTRRPLARGVEWEYERLVVPRDLPRSVVTGLLVELAEHDGWELARLRIGPDGKRYEGVASFGRRPTFDNGAPLLETFLFDFKGDLYGRTLDIAFIGFIREELKFDGIEALVKQMDDDSARARAMLAAEPTAFPKLGVIA